MPRIEGEVMSCEEVTNPKNGKSSTIVKVLEKAGVAAIYTIRDYEARRYEVGKQVSLSVWLDVYQGKRGPAVAWLASKDQSGRPELKTVPKVAV